MANEITSMPHVPHADIQGLVFNSKTGWSLNRRTNLLFDLIYRD